VGLNKLAWSSCIEVTAADDERDNGFMGKRELRDEQKGSVATKAEDKTAKRDSSRPKELARRAEDTYRTVGAFLPEIAWETDATGRFLWTNQRGHELTGYSAEDVERGVNIAQIVAPEDLSRLQANLAALFHGARGFAHEYKIRRKNGTTFPALVHTIPVVDDGKTIGLRGILVDLETARSQRLLQSVLDAIGDGICALDRDLNILHANKTLESWYPDTKVLVGKKCYAALHGRTKPCAQCPARRALATGKLEVDVANGPKGGAAPRWLELNAVPLFDSAGNVSGVVEYGRDITERKLAEQPRDGGG
jgi:PAS domain S-box-containing protein